MQSVEEFMRAYLCGRSAQVEKELAFYKPFRERFFTHTCSWGDRQEEKKIYDSETVESVSVTGEVGIAITRSDGFIPGYRYHLEKSNDSWLICCIEPKCLFCHGQSGNTSCGGCGGTGWMDTSIRS
jgi:hypothetical protein